MSEKPDYYNRYGEKRPWSDLVARFGDVVYHAATPQAGPVWRCVALIERAPLDQDLAVTPWMRDYLDAVQRLQDESGIEEAATIIVSHRTADGMPAIGLRAAWYWPDAPADPHCGPAGGVPAGMIPGRCVSGLTNGDGLIGHAMGRGAYYWPPNIGPHAVWVYGAETASDVIDGLGMLGGTDHEHLDVMYMQVTYEPPEPPPPEPPPAGPILVELDKIDAAVAQIRALVAPGGVQAG